MSGDKRKEQKINVLLHGRESMARSQLNEAPDRRWWCRREVEKVFLVFGFWRRNIYRMQWVHGGQIKKHNNRPLLGHLCLFVVMTAFHHWRIQKPQTIIWAFSFEYLSVKVNLISNECSCSPPTESPTPSSTCSTATLLHTAFAPPTPASCLHHSGLSTRPGAMELFSPNTSKTAAI